MPQRIQEILLVSSAYDAFVLEEDGSLTDRLFTEYSELQLSGVPRITHATSARQAMDMMRARRFDLVMTVVRVEDRGVIEFSGWIKEQSPDLPIVLLAFDESDLGHFPGGQLPATIDYSFLWTGDTRTLLAAIKLIEDTLNVDHDTDSAGVRVILVVEDRMRVYSTFLALLYPALMQQARSLIDEGLNDLHRVMRMRARPKILLANTFDEGLALFQRYQPYALALVSDVRFPQAGVEAAEAGLELGRRIRAESPDLPILLQSSELRDDQAAELGAWFLDKSSPTYLEGLDRFLRDALGFGDFVFRLPDGTEVGRARNIFEMPQVIESMPPESVALHATRNDFSTWLNARSMFVLADLIRRRTSAEFADVEEVRRYLVEVIERARDQEQEGVIADFSPRQIGPENRFIRIGRGSLGGKGRSVAFLSALIVRHGLLHGFEGLEIRIPKTVVLGTDVFDAFMSQYDFAALFELEDDAAILEAVLEGSMPAEIQRDLRSAFDALKGPLAVRSSSVVEDSRFQPFAGVYATYMLPNNHRSADVRFLELCRAVKGVYASSYSREARTYAAGTPHLLEGQKMAVLIQQVVGQPHGDRFYPHMSGVAQSHNDYPIGVQKPEDGVAIMALGMGETVVSGRTALRFSPGAPRVLPQFPTARALLHASQNEFYAVNLSRPRLDLSAGPEDSLSLHTLADAEEDGTLTLVGSVYCTEDDVIRDNLALAGPRVVSFNNILRWNAVPVAAALCDLLKLLRVAMGGEVELEFAVDMGRWGSQTADTDRARLPRLYLLQVRPSASTELQQLDFDFDALEPSDVLCRTNRSLGHGLVEGILDVVYVKRDDVDGTMTKQVAAEVGRVNSLLSSQDRGYVLIGPGRWGTSDPSLGIPVDWAQISGVSVIVETPMRRRHVEHSQGTHFFQNVTSRRIGYLTLAADADPLFDVAWLDSQPAATETQYVRHVELASPLSVHLDGRHGRAAILK